MEVDATEEALRSLQQYRWGWWAMLPDVYFIGKPVALRVDTQPIPTGGPSPPLDEMETALVRLILGQLPALLAEVERHYREHAESPDIIDGVHEPSVWLSRDVLAAEGPDRWSFEVGIMDAPDWSIQADFAGLAFQCIWSGD